MLGRYRTYLIGERGLTAGTARCYVDAVRPFLSNRLGTGGLDLAGVTAADVSAFILTACPGRARGSAKLIVTSVRSFLAFAHVEGLIGSSLVSALIEREVRNGMRRQALDNIALYPEFRDCKAPSTERILEIFTTVARHQLHRDGTLIQTFQPELTAQQQQILELLGVSPSAYTQQA